MVAAVEISQDQGGSWHPADGTGVWRYMWHGAMPAEGEVMRIMARASDDSANLGVWAKLELTAS